VPLAAYMDRHSTLTRNDAKWTLEEQLAGEQERTQVGRALAELGIEIIYALSPQAKGRVERLWGTLQDRLVSELRLANACTTQEAERVLEKYRRAHNKRFAISAQVPASAWRASPGDMTVDDICAIHHVRVVQNNNTVRIGRRLIDIPKHKSRATFARSTVLVCHHLNGWYRIFFKGQHIASDRGKPPTETGGDVRTEAQLTRRRETAARWRKRQREVTESLCS
jgi:hypothetical protein